MAQTRLGYNELMFGTSDTTFRASEETIKGAADLAAGTIIVRDDSDGDFRAAVDADKVNTGAASVDATWRILLEDAAVSGGDVTAHTGKSGGIAIDDLVAATGLTLDDAVYAKLEMNNIYVQNMSDAVRVAGE